MPKKISVSRRVNKNVSIYIKRILRPSGKFSEVAVNETFIADLKKKEKYQVSHHDGDESITGSDYYLGINNDIVFKAQAKILFVKDKQTLWATTPKRLGSTQIDEHYKALLNNLRTHLSTRNYFLTLAFLSSPILNQAQLQIMDCIFSTNKFYPVFVYYCSPEVKKCYKDFQIDEDTLHFACSYDIASLDLGSSDSFKVSPNSKYGKTLATALYTGFGTETFWKKVMNQNGYIFFTEKEVKQLKKKITDLKRTSSKKLRNFSDDLIQKVNVTEFADLNFGLNLLLTHKPIFIDHNALFMILDLDKSEMTQIFNNWKRDLSSLLRQQINIHREKSFTLPEDVADDVDLITIKY